MVLSLLTGLFGCTGQRTEPWESLTYHVTSSVQAEGCHFVVTRDPDGNMSLSGYCFAGDREYRADRAKPVSREAAAALAVMDLDGLATAKKHRLDVADGVQTTVTLGYSGGKERKISLSVQQRRELQQLLQEELIEK